MPVGTLRIATAPVDGATLPAAEGGAPDLFEALLAGVAPAQASGSPSAPAIAAPAKAGLPLPALPTPGQAVELPEGSGTPAAVPAASAGTQVSEREPSPLLAAEPCPVRVETTSCDDPADVVASVEQLLALVRSSDSVEPEIPAEPLPGSEQESVRIAVQVAPPEVNQAPPVPNAAAPVLPPPSPQPQVAEPSAVPIASIPIESAVAQGSRSDQPGKASVEIAAPSLAQVDADTPRPVVIENSAPGPQTLIRPLPFLPRATASAEEIAPAAAPPPAEWTKLVLAPASQPGRVPDAIGPQSFAPLQPQPIAGAQPAHAPAEILVEHQLDLATDGAWLDQLASDIAAAGEDGAPLRFRLNPETLGSLRVEISQERHGAAVRLTAETEAARAIIAEAQPRLLAEARAQGIRISEAHVDLGQGSASGDPRRQPATPNEPQLRTARSLQDDRESDGNPTERRSDRFA